jgi:hypothetical protein
MVACSVIYLFPFTNYQRGVYTSGIACRYLFPHCAYRWSRLGALYLSGLFFHLIGALIRLSDSGNSKLLGYVADEEADCVALVTLQSLSHSLDETALFIRYAKAERVCAKH